MKYIVTDFKKYFLNMINDIPISKCYHLYIAFPSHHIFGIMFVATCLPPTHISSQVLRSIFDDVFGIMFSRLSFNFFNIVFYIFCNRLLTLTTICHHLHMLLLPLLRQSNNFSLRKTATRFVNTHFYLACSDLPPQPILSFLPTRPSRPAEWKYRLR